MKNNFKLLSLKSSYESGEDDLIEEFYAPVLRCATSYDRIAGFFSSSSLAVAARGIVGLIRNCGKMRLIACPRLDEKDVEVIKAVEDDPCQFLGEKLWMTFDDLEDGFQENHIMALGWMLANGYLEIKLALINSQGRFCTSTEIEQTGIFHQKVGILTDDYKNKISFSGSINETASGWLKNIEEFKVFRSWSEEKKYLDNDDAKFQAYWDNMRDNVKTYSLPDSIKKRLIEKSHSFSVDKIIVKKYKNYLKQREKSINLICFFIKKRE